MSCWPVFFCCPCVKIIPCSDTLTLLQVTNLWCSVHFSLLWTVVIYFFSWYCRSTFPKTVLSPSVSDFIPQTIDELLWTCWFQLWVLCVGGESDSDSDSDSDCESERSHFSSGEKVRPISLTQTISRLVSVLHYSLLKLLSAKKLVSQSLLAWISFLNGSWASAQNRLDRIPCYLIQPDTYNLCF